MNSSHRLSFSALVIVLCASLGVAQGLQVAKVSAGREHSLALLSDGTVRSWGRNDALQLGIGPSPGQQNTPQVVGGLGGVVAIAAGWRHNLALVSDGTVRAWGANSDGQLGVGQYWGFPQVVGGLSGVVAIAAGANHSLALLSDGTVWAWGSNDSGQLGLSNPPTYQGAYQSVSTPHFVSGLSGVTAIAAGQSHSLALMSDGTVRAWGRAQEGQLGNGPGGNSPTPQVVIGLSSVAAITAGPIHSLALMNDGTVRAWGSNLYGELGVGNTSQQSFPQMVSGLNGVAAIAAGGFHSMAVMNNGTARIWGRNDYGQLGLGNTTQQCIVWQQPTSCSTTPQVLSGLSGVTALAGNIDHTLVVATGGMVLGCGWNVYGQLGLGNTTGSFSTPQPVPGFGPLSAPAEQARGAALDFQLLYPNVPTPIYYIDFSLTGKTPGIVVPGVGTIPLNAPLIYTDYGSMLPGFFSGFLGVIGSTGTATASVSLPINLPIVGQTVHGGSILIDPLAPTQIGAILNGTTTLIVNPMPVAQNIMAATGPAYGGVAVSIGGSNFVPGASVTFGGTAATGIAVQNNSVITCTPPAHAPGAVDVVITNPGPGSALSQSMFAAYTYATPSITGVTPTSGLTSGGASVVVTGSGFGPGSTVSFGGAPATNVVVQSAAVITCDTPAHSAGLVDVVVSQPVVGSVTAAAYTYLPSGISITAVTPGSGFTSGGTSVVVTGSGFGPSSVVNFGGAQATNIVVQNNNVITCTTAAHAVGAVDVVVHQPVVGSVTFTGGFIYAYQYAAPTLTGLSIGNSPIAGGAPVVISGTGFQSGAAVTFGGVPMVNAVITATSITGTTPPHALGATDVVILNPDTQSATASGAFAFIPNLMLGALTPAVPTPGAVVTLTGDGFQTGLSLSVGGVAIVPTVLSQTQLMFVMPGGAVCPTAVALTNPSTQFATLSFNLAPAVTSLWPSVGPLAGGTTVLIVGANFAAGSTVTFAGTNAAVLSVAATSIMVTAPAANAGTVSGTLVPVVITSPNGCTGGSTYTYQ